ncbi:MAG: EutN/CcmL family microcompartment protein [Spirochaetia bacterium]|nr:EutN/CcmL family microcompartment protein [Spirochaetia bacterium]MBR5672587.1 EutN/CcmL family microcompartment protein [Spirochaetales bacterium]MBR4796532.1 EutN/CcmL family microcompartment protein [Spirochaetia bacterium]MBR5017947.1 EutN/CcmL family microcompartment protein [Spirochaetia bacterium]MBR5916285.1 EutN/CcmL family microcompartment protein [Spirochaetia bacterium]
MKICRVIGHVWATKKEERLEGLKLMVVQEDEPGKSKKEVFVAADTVCAGIGDQIIVVSGSTARRVFGRDDMPVDEAIVAIIDNLEIGQEVK